MSLLFSLLSLLLSLLFHLSLFPGRQTVPVFLPEVPTRHPLQPSEGQGSPRCRPKAGFLRSEGAFCPVTLGFCPAIEVVGLQTSKITRDVAVLLPGSDVHRVYQVSCCHAAWLTNFLFFPQISCWAARSLLNPCYFHLPSFYFAFSSSTLRLTLPCLLTLPPQHLCIFHHLPA